MANWKLWKASRAKSVDTQTMRRLSQTAIVKSGSLTAATLYQQIQDSGIKIQPRTTANTQEKDYHKIIDYVKAAAILNWITGLLILINATVIIIVMNK